MAKIVVIYPKWRFGEEVTMLMPLSLLCIASPLVRKGYDVKIVDLRINGSEEDLLEEVRRSDILCVGVSLVTSGPQIYSALDISQKIKAILPHVPIVWGGVHPSLLPEQTLRSSCPDIVAIGEGEETFTEFVECLQTNSDYSGIRGLAFRHGDAIVKTPDGCLYSYNI